MTGTRTGKKAKLTSARFPPWSVATALRVPPHREFPAGKKRLLRLAASAALDVGPVAVQVHRGAVIAWLLATLAAMTVGTPAGTLVPCRG